MRILNSCVVQQDSILQTGVYSALQPHTFYARLRVFDKTLAQPRFAVVNCSDAMMQARNQRGEIEQFSPRNFHKRMYLLGAATSYIILPPPKISVGCGPAVMSAFSYYPILTRSLIFLQW